MADVSDGRPETDLLICCASLDAQRLERISELLTEKIDWNLLLSRAQMHGILPLLYWNINSCCPEKVPETVILRLKEDFQKNARRNLILTGELFRILELLKSKGIDAVPFKGPVLAYAAYGNPALRYFVDLDILVREKDVQRANEVLQADCYLPQISLNSNQEARFLKSECERAFYRKNPGIIVEIHWQITPDIFKLPFEVDQLWSRIEPISLSGKKVNALSAEDLLLVLCIHGSKHHWSKLKWICDVARLIDLREMNWPKVARQASLAGCGRMLRICLLLAGDLLKAPIPIDVLQRAKEDAMALEMTEQVQSWLYSDIKLGFIDSTRFWLKTREHISEKVQICWSVTTTPTAEDWTELLVIPESLYVLYYFTRPIRLFKKYVLSPSRNFLMSKNGP